MFAARAARRGDDVALVVLGDPATVVASGSACGDDRCRRRPRRRTPRSPGAWRSCSPRTTRTSRRCCWRRGRTAARRSCRGAATCCSGRRDRSGGAIPYRGLRRVRGGGRPAASTRRSSRRRSGRPAAGYVESRYGWDDVLTRYEWFLEDAIAHWRPPSVVATAVAESDDLADRRRGGSGHPGPATESYGLGMVRIRCGPSLPWPPPPPIPSRQPGPSAGRGLGASGDDPAAPRRLGLPRAPRHPGAQGAEGQVQEQRARVRVVAAEPDAVPGRLLPGLHVLHPVVDHVLRRSSCCPACSRTTSSPRA